MSSLWWLYIYFCYDIIFFSLLFFYSQTVRFIPRLFWQQFRFYRIESKYIRRVFVSMCSLWFLFVWRGKIANIIMLDANACGKSLHGIFCHSATYERLKRQSRNYDGCCLNIYIKIHTIQTPIVVWLCFTFDFSFTLSLYYLGRWSLCSADIGRIIGLVGACVFVFIECLFRITISDEKKKK